MFPLRFLEKKKLVKDPLIKSLKMILSMCWAYLYGTNIDI